LRERSGGEWIWALAISLGTALLIVAPFFVLGIASGHDFEFHAASWLDAAGQWKEGILFPRWTEWANHGFGEPRFIFYPPLSWVLGAALGSVMHWNAVPIVFIVLVQTVAGLCAFALARSVTLRAGALFGAVCYAANPYALLVIYMRSDFAEQLATAFFPLLLLLGLRAAGILGNEETESGGTGVDPAEMGGSSAAPLQSQRRDISLRNIALFGAVFAVVWLSNAPAGVMASYAMTLVFFWAVLRQRSVSPGLRGVAGLVLGFVLTAFYLLPAAYEQRWVNIEQALSSGLQPAQNFLFTVIDDPEHTLFNWVASGIAILLIVVTGLAAVWSHRAGKNSLSGTLRENERSETWFITLLLATAGTISMLRASDIFWRWLPKLRFVQFPWRWMCVLAICYALFLARAFGESQGQSRSQLRSQRRWILLAGFAVVSAGTGAILIHEGWWDTEDLPTLRAAIADSSGFDGTDEYDPRGDDHYNLPAKSPKYAVWPSESSDDGPPPDAQVRIEKWTAAEKRLQVSSPAPARIALRLLDYPAWRLEVNGKKLAPEHADGSAQMVVPVDAGESEIRVSFTATWDRRWGMIVSLLSAIIAVLMLAVRWPAGGRFARRELNP
jgi:hypothetical protein